MKQMKEEGEEDGKKRQNERTEREKNKTTERLLGGSHCPEQDFTQPESECIRRYRF